MTSSLSFTERKLESLKRWTLLFHANHPLHNGLSLSAPKKERIRYIGWCNKDNFGDTILADLFKHYFANFLVWPAYPQETVEALLDGWFQKSTSSHFALGGGTLITNRYLEAVEKQISADRDFFTFGSGCLLGKELETEKVNRWSACLNATSFLGVRGPLSAEMCATVYNAPHVDIVGDTALATAELYPTKKKVDDVVRVGVNLGTHKYSGSNPNLETMVRMLNRFRDHEVEFVQISMHPIDEIKTREAFEKAGIEPVDHIRLYEKAADLSEFSTLSVVLGERLHASILAHAYGIPAIGLSYDLKHTDHFLAMEQTSCLIDVQQPKEAKLSELVEQTLSGGAELRSRIEVRRDFLTHKLGKYIDEIKAAWRAAT